MKATQLISTFLLAVSSSSWASRTPFATERLDLVAYTVWSIPIATHGCRSVYVRDPDGYIYLLGLGDYIGRNGGKVDAIDDVGIVVIELIPDGKGGWKEHRVRMELPAYKQPEAKARSK